THRAWRRAMAQLAGINALALEGFDQLADGGVEAPTRDAGSFIAAYRTEAEQQAMVTELEQIRAAGQPIDYHVVTGAEARAIEPALSEEFRAGVVLKDQRFINPGQYVHALADAVVDRGGTVRDDAEIV